MKKKTFLTLALVGLVALAHYIPKEIEKDKQITHSTDICMFTDILYDLGLKDLAYQHQTNRINASELYDAEYKKIVGLHMVGQVTYPEKVPESFSVFDRHAFNSDGINLEFNKYVNGETLTISYPDPHIELSYNNELIKEIRIR